MYNEHLQAQLSYHCNSLDNLPENILALLSAVSESYDRFDAMTENSRNEKTNNLLQRNQDLEQFTYIISHNLRAPVANIRALTALVQNPRLDKDSFGNCLKGLEKAVERLDELIFDLNNILKIKNEINEKKVTVHFSEVAQSVTNDLKHIIDAEHAVVETDFVQANKLFTIKSYLHSIFYNLISNSLKYKKPDASPLVSIRSHRLKNHIKLVFADNSMGIDMSRYKDKIFGLYKRFHSHAEGKGMGLFMVKTQVESIGGKIYVNSEVNKGTEFTLEFHS